MREIDGKNFTEEDVLSALYKAGQYYEKTGDDHPLFEDIRYLSRIVYEKLDDDELNRFVWYYRKHPISPDAVIDLIEEFEDL
jgi:hypothetical protein